MVTGLRIKAYSHKKAMTSFNKLAFILMLLVLIGQSIMPVNAAFTPLTVQDELGGASFTNIKKLNIIGGVVTDLTNGALSFTTNGDVTSGNVIADNALVRGDGGAKGIQGSAIIIDDSDNMSGVTSINVDGTTGNTVVVDTTTLVVDAANNRVGIGTAAPSTDLDVNGTVRIRGGSPAANFVLAAVNNTGLATWKDVADILNDGGAFLDALNDAISDKDSNLFLGNGSGLTNSGEYNTGVGILALNANTAGNGNTAMGYKAVNPNTTGNFNTGFGAFTLNSATTGNGNVAVGYHAGYAVVNGDYNLTLGYQAGDNITTGSRNIILGYNIDASSATDDDQLNIGDTVYGSLASDDIAIGTSTLDGAFTVNQTDAADIFNLKDSGTTVFTVVDGGNVGIGTANPSVALDIATGDVFVQSGNVGIGVNATNFDLEIAGNIGPSTDSTYDIGSNATRFRFGYFDDMAVTTTVTATNFNGTTANLSGSAHVAGTVNGGLFDGDFTNGSILFSNASGVLSQDNANFFYADDTNQLFLGGTTAAAADVILGADGAIIFNEQGNDSDFRIESDTDANVFVVDASANNIGIGVATPSTFKLEIAGNVGPSAHNTHSLGSTAVRWANTYSNNFNGATAYITNYYGTNATLSGTVNGTTGIFDDATVNDDLVVSDDFAVTGDSIFSSTATFSTMTAGSVPFFGASGLLSQDNANFFYNNTTDALYLGAATAGNADIILNNGGAATFNEQGNDSDFRVESDSNANMLFVDASTNRVGISTGAPSTTLDVNGTVRIRGGSPAANFVLAAVDATGLASWADVSDILNDGGAFLNALNDAISDNNSNLFLGNGSGLTNAGEYNTGVGILALNSNTAGNGNTAMGYKAVNPNTTGNFNTGFGAYTLNGATVGNGNVAIGYRSAYAVTNGDYNLTLGHQAGDNITTGSRNIILGYDIDAQTATGNDQLNIGDTIYGNLSTDDIAIGTSTLDGAFVVNQTHAADIFNLQDSGTTVFTVIDGGNVGIGVAAPGSLVEIGDATLGTVDGVNDLAVAGDTEIDGSLYVDTNFRVTSTATFSAMTAGSVPFFGASGLLSQDNANFFYNNTTDALYLGAATAGNADIILSNGGSATFNEQGNDSDFRIESDTDANVFVVDASANNIGIGVAAPSAFKLQIAGSIGPNVDSTNDLGSTGTRWRFGYFDDMAVTTTVTATNFNGTDATLSNDISVANNGDFGNDVSITDDLAVGDDATIGDDFAVTGDSIFSSTATFSTMTAGSIFFAGTAGLLSQDNANFFYNNTTDALYLGAATAGNADIILNNGGAATFNEQGNDSDFRVESDSNANMLFVDASTNRVGISTGAPSTTLDVNGTVRIRGGSPAANFVLAAVDATGLASWADVSDILNDGGAFLNALNDAISDNNSNLFLGNGSGLTNAGEYNTGVGILALNSNTAGNGNTAMGYKAVNPNTTGNFNTGFGAYTLNTATVGNGNVALGYRSAYAVTNGDYNLTLGFQSGENITTGSRNIILGYDIDAQTATGNDQLNIGDTVYGSLATDDIAIGTSTLDGAFAVNQTHAADIFNLQDSGTTVFTVIDGGNVGIGVAAPGSLLEVGDATLGTVDGVNDLAVAGDAEIDGSLYVDTNFRVTSTATFSAMTAGSVPFFGASGLLSQDNANFFYNNTTDALYLGAATAGNADIILSNGGSATFNEQGNDSDFRIESDTDANVFVVDASANNIGIGVATPSTFKLEIAGNVGPSANNTHSLGSTAVRWANTYSNNFNGATAYITNYYGTNATLSGTVNGTTGIFDDATVNDDLVVSDDFAVTGDSIFSSTVTFSTMTAGSIFFAGTSGLLSQDNANFFYNNTTDALYLGAATAGNADIILNNGGSATFNEQGNDSDFRVESDSNANMLFVDASTNRVGIGTNAPTVALDVNGVLRVRNATAPLANYVLAAADTAGTTVWKDVSDILNDGGAFLNALNDAISDNNSNLFLGNGSGLTNAGEYNTGVGILALNANTAGNGNTAMGYKAVNPNTTGNFNTGFGAYTLNTATVGNGNVALGYRSAYAVTNGDYNLTLGYQAGDNITTGSRNIILGYDIDAQTATGNDQLNIGDTIYGNLSTDDIAIGTSTLDGAFAVNQTHAADIFNLQDSGTTVFTVIDGGNVGIGVAAPGSLVEIGDATLGTVDGVNDLAVAGDTEIDGSLYVDTNFRVTSTATFSAMTAGSVPFFGASGLLSQDNANFFYNNTTDALYLGAATAGNADIILSNGGSATFNEQGNDSDFRIESDTDANVFVVDASANNIGIGVATPSTFKLEIAGNVGPSANNTHSLGSTAVRWANTYSNNFNGATAYITNYYGTNATLSGTINGTTGIFDDATVNDDLGVSDDFTVTGDSVFSSTVTFSTMTAGSIFFAGTSGLLSQDNANFFYNNTTDALYLGAATAGNADIILNNGGSATFNEQGNDSDFRVESDSNANMLFVDASTNRVGIGTSAPSVALDVNGSFRVRASGTPTANFVLASVDTTGLTVWKDVSDILNDGGAFLNALNDAISDNNSNLFLGNGSGLTNAGEYNTGVGILALNANTAGNGNTAMGYKAVNPNTTGNFNTGFGAYTLNTATVGNGNVALGYRSAYAVTDGDYNLTLGYQAGDNITTGNRNIVLGYNIDAQSATGNDQLNIGDTIYGNLSTDDIAIGTSTLDGAFTVNQTDAADIFNLKDSGTTIFTVLDGGNVGIGVAAPGSLLEVGDATLGTVDGVNDLAVAGDAEIDGSLYVDTNFRVTSTATFSAMTAGSVPFFGTSGLLSQDNANFFYNNTTDALYLGAATAGSADIILSNGGSATFNEQGNDSDFRIESDTDANVFVVDASANNIGIGVATPSNFKLEIAGNIGPSANNTHSLGSTAARWANTYSNNFNGSTSYVSTYYGVNATLSGTINGTTAIFDDATVNDDLVVSDDFSVTGDSVFSSTVTFSTMTAGSIFFAGTAGLLSQDNANFFYNNTTDALYLGAATAGNADIILNNGGSATFNEQGNDSDFRVESDSNANMLFVDASTNRVGIGTSAPSVALDVNGVLRVRSGGTPAANYVLSAVDSTGLVNWKSVSDILNNGGAFINALNDAISDKNSNLFLGNGSGLTNSGEYNTGVGILALNSNTAGNGNTAVGYKAINPNTTGNFNTGFGAYALNTATVGNGNIAIGYRSAYAVTDGDYNLTLGYQAGDNITTGNRNIILGYNVDATSATGNDQLNIGDMIFGNFSSNGVAIGTSTIDGTLSLRQDNAADSFNVYDGATNVFTIIDGGNVGIGVTTPSTFKLEVAGNIGPSANNTHNLGSTAVKWSNTYSNNFNGSTSYVSTYYGANAILTGTINGTTLIGDNLTVNSTATFAGTTFDVNSTDVSFADTNISFDGASTTFTQTTGAFIFAPAAGYNFNVSLSGAGDFAVNTNQLYVDTSTSRVGINMVAPGTSFDVNGTVAYNPSATTNVTAGGGITVTKGIMRIQGSGGAVDLSANPQIADGADGQIVILKGQSNTNTITLDDGTGLSLTNSASFTLGFKDTITLMYDAVDDVWIEIGRSNR